MSAFGFLDWIYPPRCMACKQIIPIQEKEWRRFRLCVSCRALFEKISPPYCERCGCPADEDGGAPSAHNPGEALPDGCPSCFGKHFSFERNLSAFRYDGILRDILLDVKFHGKKQCAAGLGELWASALSESETGLLRDGLAVPVPMYPRKKRARGFNQAEVLAAAVAKASGARMLPDLLKRAVDTPPQSGLTARARAENVRGVFKLNGRYNIEGMKIILIDDIFTTGSSLNACAEVLRRGGAGKIICVTLAASVKNKNVI